MPCFIGSKIFLALARRVHYIVGRKESFRKKEEKENEKILQSVS